MREHEQAYEPKQRRVLQKYLDAVIFQYKMAEIALEQLCSAQTTTNSNLYQMLEIGLETLDCRDDEKLVNALCLEQFVLQAASLLDIYMLYTLAILGETPTQVLGYNKFRKRLTALGEKRGVHGDKAQAVSRYFENTVFGKYRSNPDESKGWGSVIDRIGNVLIQKEHLMPQVEESPLANIVHKWPAIKTIGCDAFCRDMENGIFYLLFDLGKVLYERT